MSTLVVGGSGDSSAGNIPNENTSATRPSNPQVTVEKLNQLLAKTFKRPIDKITSENEISFNQLLSGTSAENRLKYYGVSLTHRIQVKTKRYPPFYSPAGSESQSPRSCSRNCHLTNGMKLEMKSFIEFTPDVYERLKCPRYASWFNVVSITDADAVEDIGVAQPVKHRITDKNPIYTPYVGFGDFRIFVMGEILPSSCYTSKNSTVCNYDMRKLKEITDINDRNSFQSLCFQLVFEDELPETVELEVTEMNAVLYDSSLDEATYVFVDPSWYV